MASSQESGSQQQAGIFSSLSLRIEQYTRIGERVAPALGAFLKELWSSFREGNVRVLFKNRDVQERSFARWFKANGHGFVRYEDTTAVPDLVERAHGIVLDLGAGIGNQVQRFDHDKVEHIFGIEPNTLFATALTDRIKAEGLEGKYTPVFCGVEDTAELKKHGIVPGSVDCVVCMQVLCSVDKPADVAREMYSLLKPGGELLFWEHHRSHDRLTRVMQWLWSSVWSVSLAGCRLDRPVRDSLVRAGDWELVQIEADKDGALIMPRVWGRLVKRSA